MKGKNMAKLSALTNQIKEYALNAAVSDEEFLNAFLSPFVVAGNITNKNGEEFHLSKTRTSEIMDLCEETQNKHLLWFLHMLDAHFEGIIAHATYRHVSSGKIEGINNKIKTLRRQGYGYPDDEYFFLKLFDASRTTYVRNPASHRICD